MPRAEVHQCECPHCQQDTPHPDQELHRQMNLLLSRLDEKTIQRGRQELASSLAERPEQRVRLPGAGRPRAEKKTRRKQAPWRG